MGTPEKNTLCAKLRLQLAEHPKYSEFNTIYKNEIIKFIPPEVIWDLSETIDCQQDYDDIVVSLNKPIINKATVFEWHNIAFKKINNIK